MPASRPASTACVAGTADAGTAAAGSDAGTSPTIESAGAWPFPTVGTTGTARTRPAAAVIPAHAGFVFDNTYARELEGCYVRWEAAHAPQPAMLRLNRALAGELGLDADALDSPAGAAIFAGNALPAGAEPLAQAYAGHQFGGFSPQLGDGRALLLGELVDRHGRRRDIHLKGSGRTPFSRGGDGKAAVGPVLREYLIGEAMHALGIPTTRALAAVATGEPVRRETMLPGAVLARVASSHLRVGTFQYFAVRGESERIRRLVAYALARHYPERADDAKPALALLDAVCAAQAALVARWMQVGFIHGVMNTDNMTISGETIDYGPCAFMDRHDADTVFSSIDTHGRYAYGNQPGIAQWNLARLAEALLGAIDDDGKRAVALATEVVNAFGARYRRAWLDGMRAKLGLAASAEDGDFDLANGFLAAIADQNADHTLAFRRLSLAALGDDAPLRALLDDDARYAIWAGRWRERLMRDPMQPAARAATMDRANPIYVPRNHRVEEALEAAVERGVLGPFETLLAVLERPFDERPGLEAYATPAANGNPGFRTFCGT